MLPASVRSVTKAVAGTLIACAVILASGISLWFLLIPIVFGGITAWKHLDGQRTPSVQRTTSGTTQGGSWLVTLLILTLLGAGGWYILKPLYEDEMAKQAAKEQRKLPVTLACDPTKYNTELLDGREANEWVTVNINAGCNAAEQVAIPLGRRQIRTDSKTDIEMRLFGPNNKTILVDGITDPDGWFTDGPTMRINAPDALAVQLRNKSAATKTTLLASS